MISLLPLCMSARHTRRKKWSKVTNYVRLQVVYKNSSEFPEPKISEFKRLWSGWCMKDNVRDVCIAIDGSNTQGDAENQC